MQLFTFLNLQVGLINRNSQFFEIDCSSGGKIKGKYGTVIIYKKNSFNKSERKVTIELIECYDIQSMISNSLTTQTISGNLLETDGMIYLNATNELGDTLSLIKDIRIEIPAKQFKNDIQIFEGIKREDNKYWKLTKHKVIKRTKVIEEKKYAIVEKYVDVDYIFPPKDYDKISINEDIKDENIPNYIFNYSNLGWINCDRFIEGKTINLIVNVDEEFEKVKYYLKCISATFPFRT